MVFFTANLSESLAANVPTTDYLAMLNLVAFLGQTSNDFMEIVVIGNPDDEDVDVTVYPGSSDIELSLDRRNWKMTVDITIPAGATSDVIYVRAIITDLLRPTGLNLNTITANGVTLPIDVDIQPLNTIRNSNRVGFHGRTTAEIRQLFLQDGEEIIVIEHVPMPVPPDDFTPSNTTEARNMNVSEWCNPYNGIVGYRIREWCTRAFIGNREVMSNLSFMPQDVQLEFSDTDSILLPDNFAGFDGREGWEKDLIFFSQMTPFQKAYKGTVWSIIRDDLQYSLRNIRRIGAIRGNLCGYYADLVVIRDFGGSSKENFNPFGILYNEDWKQIAYVSSFSRNLIIDSPVCHDEYGNEYIDEYGGSNEYVPH